MWEFTAHRYLRPTRWTWARVGHDGRTLEQSPSGFPTFADALANAAASGFRRGHDRCRMIESEGVSFLQEALSW